jgi:hypothetical protein
VGKGKRAPNKYEPPQKKQRAAKAKAPDAASADGEADDEAT